MVYRLKIKWSEDVATKLAGSTQGFLLVATLFFVDWRKRRFPNGQISVQLAALTNLILNFFLHGLMEEEVSEWANLCACFSYKSDSPMHKPEWILVVVDSRKMGKFYRPKLSVFWSNSITWIFFPPCLCRIPTILCQISLHSETLTLEYS